MIINDLLHEKNLSIYRLSRLSGVPYTTLNDICSEKTKLEKCSAETVYRIAHTLNISMEDLLSQSMNPRSSFENFKSTVCHRVKTLGDIEFIRDTLVSHDVRKYYDRKWYPESFYLLAMLDYISRINDIPLCNEYDDLRCQKLEKPLYPAGVRAMSAATRNDQALKSAEQTAIPEFFRFNIIENEIRDVA